MSLVTVENLTVAFGNRVVVDDVSLHAGPRRDAGAGRRKRFRQVADRAVAAATAADRAPTSRPAALVLDGQERDRRRASKLLRRLRGGVAGMVFQEPMTSLNPLHRIGSQIAEAVRCTSRSARRLRGRGSIELLDAGRLSPMPRTGSTRFRTSFPAASASA